MDFALNTPWMEREEINPIFLDPYYGERAIIDIVTEANDPASGKTIGQRIGAALKKIFQWLVDRVKTIIQKWTGAIRSNVRLMDPDAVIASIGVKPRTGDDVPQAVPITIEMVSEGGASQEVTKNIKLQARPIHARQDPNNPNQFVIRLAELEKVRHDMDTAPVHQGCVSTAGGAQMALWLICNKNGGMEKIGNLIKSMGTPKFNDLWMNGGREMINKLYAAKSFMPDLFGVADKTPVGMKKGEVVFTMDQMNIFYKWLVEMNQYAIKIDEVDAAEGATVTMTEGNMKNTILGVLTGLQFGVNWLLGEIGGHHVISKEYYETIDSFEQMSQFVKGMIDQHLASKYIIYNITMAATPKLKTDASVKKPRCGQSRLVIYPTDQNVVLKFALGAEGLRANALENRLCHISGMDSLLAPVEQITKDNAGLMMGRCRTLTKSEQASSKYDKLADKIRDDIAEQLEQQGVPMAITDIHTGNIGYNKANKLVCYDYGAATRSWNKAF